MKDGQFETLYQQIEKGEKETEALLLQFEQDYPGVMKESNIDQIADDLQEKTDRASILALLRKK